ncbi:MAG: nucleotidyltransferase family protein [Bacteroidia bacterium]
MRLSQNQIEKIKTYLIDKPVVKAYLFGSYSRSSAQKDSDVDILLELDYSQKIGLFFVKMKLDLEELLHKNVDLISTKGISEYVKPFVEKDKKLIYERKVG